MSAWCLWLEVQTQWRVGMGGATGLDYAGVSALLQARGYRAGSRSKSLRTMLDDIRACEAGALAGWASKRESNGKG